MSEPMTPKKRPRTPEFAWDVLDLFFRDNPKFVSKHHLESFDELVSDKIPAMIRSLNPFTTIKFDEEKNPDRKKYRFDVYVGGKDAKAIRMDYPSVKDDGAVGGRRMLYPNEARLVNLTYKSTIFADVLVESTWFKEDGTEVVERTEFKDVEVGTIPVMVGSALCNTAALGGKELAEAGECAFDRGGHFIIGGKEKVIVAKERMVPNQLLVAESNDPHFSHVAMIRSMPEEGAKFPKVVRFKVLRGAFRDGPKAAAREAEAGAAAGGDQDNDNNDAAKKKKKRSAGQTIRDRNVVVVELPNIGSGGDKEKKKPIRVPLFLLFRALGVASDKAILEHVAYGDLDDPKNKVYVDFLYPSLVAGGATGVYTQAAAMDYVSARMPRADAEALQSLFLDDLFPNLNASFGEDRGLTLSLRNKALFLGHVVRTLIRVCTGIDKQTDRDNGGFKRVDVSGFLMGNLFRDFYNDFRKECLRQIDLSYYASPLRDTAEFGNIINENLRWKLFSPDIIGQGMAASLSGRWGRDETQDGTVQDLNRLTYIGTISHLRRVQTPVDSSLKIVEPHRLHASHWGMICLCDSPDGANIGIIKNLAMLCHISPDLPSRLVTEVLEGTDSFVPLDDVMVGALAGACKVFVNNTWRGCTWSPDRLVRELRDLRRRRHIHPMTSVAWNILGERIDVFNDAGRCCRPLLVVEGGNRLAAERKAAADPDFFVKLSSGEIRWDELLTTRGDDDPAIIEFLDVTETNTSLVAMWPSDLADGRKRYTHCEVHPSTIFSVLSANIPFPEHSPSPRNTLACAQGKQALGVYNTQFANRFDTGGLVLHYPQRSVVGTRYMRYLKNNALPHGENAIVAIMCYSGFNMEDSVIVNKAAIERGMLNITYYKTIVESEDGDELGETKVVFANPETLMKQGKPIKGYGTRFGNYTMLDEDGLPKPNAFISQYDVYLGRVVEAPDVGASSASSGGGAKTYADKSLIADKTLQGTVDRVFVYSGANGKKECKIRLRKTRMPAIGDKHASRHAQKGTVGMILPAEHMPFTKDGLVPDIIINPHAIPSRKTVGHLLECVLGKVGCMSGRYMDATPFCDVGLEETMDALERMGYERHGDEVMYNAATGEQMASSVFIGPTYMQRLKHMVADKINYRARGEGGYTAITRQPVASRAKGGGLRLGEMEGCCVAGHGMSSFLKESLMDRSDRYRFGIDEDAGDVAIMNLEKGREFARSQPGGRNRFAAVETPYAAKVLLQELQAACIRPYVHIDDDDVSDVELEMYSVAEPTYVERPGDDADDTDNASDGDGGEDA